MVKAFTSYHKANTTDKGARLDLRSVPISRHIPIDTEFTSQIVVSVRVFLSHSEKCEDTKDAIRSRNSTMDNTYNGQKKKKTKSSDRQKNKYRKFNIKQHESN